MRSHRWVRKVVKRAELITVILLAAAVSTFCISQGFPDFGTFFDANHDWQVDELFTFFNFGGIATFVLLVHRALDLRRDTRQREASEIAAAPRQVPPVRQGAKTPEQLKAETGRGSPF